MLLRVLFAVLPRGQLDASSRVKGCKKYEHFIPNRAINALLRGKGGKFVPELAHSRTMPAVAAWLSVRQAI
jgi:hypothetical protein